LLSSSAATWQQLSRLDVFQFGFLLLTSISVFQLGFSSGRTFFKSPNNAKPCPLAANLNHLRDEKNISHRIIFDYFNKFNFPSDLFK